MHTLAKDDAIQQTLAAGGDTVSGKDIILKHTGPIIIYGAGATGRRVRALLARHGLAADAFLDRTGGGWDIDGVPVFKPQDYPAGKSALVIVALFSHTVNPAPVIDGLARLGFAVIVPYPKFFLWFADELPAHYWLGPAETYRAHAAQLQAVYNLLTDSASRDLFAALLRLRTTGEPGVLPPSQPEAIYAPADIPAWGRPDHLIDCGACWGDTLSAMNARFGRLDSVRAFEPDPQNFRKLAALNRRIDFSADTALIPCGVWSSTTQLRFQADSGLSSSIADDGAEVVQCVALDDCLPGYRPSLIKMDVEGSELEALKGSRRLIADARPNLAISVYHRPADLWEIPLFIESIVPDYKFYLRLHGENGYDTVLYAVPGELA